jgi:hypothetical protein
MKKTFLLYLICSKCLVCPISHAEPIQKVSIEPASGGVSFNSVAFGYTDGWLECGPMIGRKEMIIINNSTLNNLYLTGVSGSTAAGVLGPKETVLFKAASSLHIYASGSSVTMSVWEIR